MNVFKKVVALVCALAVMGAMTSPVAIAKMFIEADGVQPIGGANGTADLPVTLVDEEKPMSGKCGENLTWVLDDKGTLTISGTGDMFDFDIARLFTNFSPWAYRDDIKSVLIETGVTSVGNYAFQYCASLASVTLSNSITRIGKDAFLRCTSLSSIVIPDSVASIGDEAFAICAELDSIVIPESVASIGNAVFDGCTKLAEINVDRNNGNYCSVNGVLFNKTKTMLIGYPCGNKSTSYIVPDGVVCINRAAFGNCVNLISITLPNSVTNIGDWAFYLCTSLTSIALPSSITSIGTGICSNCTNLTSVTLSNSITSIGRRSFTFCSNLKDVYYSGTKDEWEKISLVSSNDSLINATIHYNSTGSVDIGESIGEKFSFNGHTYQMFKLKNLTSGDVISYCKKIGGYMAHINDAEENEFLKELICNNNVKYAYFGYTDENTEGKWRWIDGKTSQYTNWAAGEPNNEYGQEHYALINQKGYWNDGKFENDASNSGVVIICEFNTNANVDVEDDIDTSDISSDSDSGGSNSDYSNSNSSSNNSENNDNSSVPQTDTNSNNTTKDDVSDNANPSSNIITVPFKERNVDFYWNDDLFSGSAFEYNNDLAIASLALSGIAENFSPSDIKKVLEKMKFENIESFNYFSDNDNLKPAFVIGSKKIKIDDQEKDLISITIRGTTVDSSNLNDLATDILGGTVGFIPPVQEVNDGFSNYWTKYFSYSNKDNVILWISGHSLGGAVSSSLGAKINDQGLFKSDNIFTYSFAPPSYISHASIIKQYKNIFEVINDLDPVPDLGGPMSKHSGVTRIFDPFKAYDYANYYKEYTQKEFVPYFSRFPSFDYHACLAYMAFLKSGGAPTSLSRKNRYFISICCPVDVEVYDSDGKLLSRVTNNVCDENVTSDNVICIINGDKKYFIISTDAECQMKLTSTGSGTMEYSVQKLKSADDVVTADDFITYETVELEDGKMFYSEISNNDDIAEVNLYVVDSETNKPVKSVGLDGKETNLVKESHIWLYIVGSVIVVTMIVIFMIILRKKHKKQ